MRYQFIKENQGQFDIKLLRQKLEVSHSSYYAWLNHPQSDRSKQNKYLIDMKNQL